MSLLTLSSGVSGVVALLSLAVLVAIFGLAPAERVMRIWARKRGEVVLLWAIACLHRGAELAHMAALTFGLHLASALVTLLCAVTALQALHMERVHGR